MRPDIESAVATLPGKLQRELRKSRFLERAAGFLRDSEKVEFVCPGFGESVGVLVITTERVMFVGATNYNIPLANIIGASSNPMESESFPYAKSMLRVEVRGTGEIALNLRGSASAVEARKALDDSLMR